MDKVINDITRGRIAVMAVEALVQKAFRQIVSGTFKADTIAAHRGISINSLNTALQLLADMGWLEQSEQGVYSANSRTGRLLRNTTVGSANARSDGLPEFILRHPVAEDLSQLIELDRLTQPDGLHTPENELARRIRTTPQTILLIECEGKLAAALYSQRIDSVDALNETDYAHCTCLQRADGRHIQLLGLYVLPAMTGRGYSDVLIESMLLYARLLGSVQSVVGVTRCADYPQHREEFSVERWIWQRNASGEWRDEMLHFHTSHGARVCRLLPGFRPGDTDNDGAGVLIEYSSERLSAAGNVTTLVMPPAKQVRPTTLNAEQIEPLVRGILLEILGKSRADNYHRQLAFMEMGLTSLELLAFRRQLNAGTGLALDSTFFFSHYTVEAVCDYLKNLSKTPIPANEPVLPPADAIAIVGMACRFPGGLETPEQFWQALLQGSSVVGPMPAARAALRRPGSAVFRWQAGFLQDIDRFDAAFFRVSPREAEWLDPQQRLLLEVSWQALEDAAVAPASVRGGNNGIFVGLMSSDYGVLTGQCQPEMLDAQFATGSACSVAAGRLAWFLDWRGPAVTVDTACSSSLVAVHQACRSLLSGECQLALAAGANVLLDDQQFLAFERAGMLSPEGRCHSFDRAADGYVRAEGCAALVLKRLADAESDGDRIIAVLRGSAMNQDGASASLTAPNPQAQQAVIAAALKTAAVEGASVSYLEAHGTGTPLGDPIEVQAAASVLCSGRAAENPLLMGSVKNNIGHLEAAAGLAGLIKVVLSLQHGVIPGQADFSMPSHHIPWGALPVAVVSQSQPWPPGIKRAGVSSFGFSGTNCHAIVEEYVDKRAPCCTSEDEYAIILSARTHRQLKSRVQQLCQFLRQQPADLRSLACTLQTGRDAMTHRLGFVAGSLVEVISRLQDWLAGEDTSATIFTGSVSEELSQTAGGVTLQENVRCWVQGSEVDWHSQYAQLRPAPMSLPTYPFDDQRYWLPDMAVPATLPEPGILMLMPSWQPEERNDPPPAVPAEATLWLSNTPATLNIGHFSTALFTPYDSHADLAEKLSASVFWQHVVWQVPAGEETAAQMGLRLVKALLAQGYAHRALQLSVLTQNGQAIAVEEQVDPNHASVAGLMKTLVREYPHWQVQILDLPVGDAFALWPQRPGYSAGRLHTWRHGKWFNQRMVPCPPTKEKTIRYRQNGVYVIVGGAGGIGIALSEFLIRQYQAQLIWLGRRAQDKQITRDLTRLAAAGPEPLYLQADACDRLALQRAGEQIKARFGAIHGVVHAAMDLADAPLAQMDEARFRRGLNAKRSAQHLPALWGECKLDFLMFFSSVYSFLSVSGAANYTAGCCFADACAHNYRQQGCPVRVINWGYWGETGGCASPAYQSAMAQTGLAAIAVDEAMAVTEQLLAQPYPQVLFARTQGDNVARQLDYVPSTSADSDGHSFGKPEEPAEDLLQFILIDLIGQAEQLLKLPAGTVEGAVNLNQYGVDSVMLMMYARQLSQRYQLDLSPALFYSHTTLQQFAEYLLTFFSADLSRRFPSPVMPSSAAAAQPVSQTKPVAVVAEAAPACTTDVQEAIAIVGLSGRFAGARSTEQLWELLYEGRSTVADYPACRLTQRTPPRPRWLAAAPGIDEFDPLFFEISPHEAALTDPRQRLLLQEGWRALEDAACGEEQLRERTISLFVGVEAGDYGQLIGDKNTLTANHEAILASRLAYMLNLSGGVQAINTACSSSLVALHQACQSLRQRECDTAIAAGVNVLSGTTLWDQMDDAGIVADDGICHAFDQRGSGMVPGEAAVAVVLRRLSDALADGDPIRGVIVGSGINYDGKTQGITAPGGKAQATLLSSVWQRYGIDPDRLEYVVAHGTGTALGDPVEINALCEAFAPHTQRQQFCAVTSNKPNVGHALAASGLVSLANLVLAMEKETIPATLHAEQPSSWVDWPQTPFFINTTARAWPAKEGSSRLGAVSAFGMSGTNAHVVVQGKEGLPRSEEPEGLPWTLLVLSAKTEAALRLQAEALIDTINDQQWDRAALQQVSHTLLSGRHHFAWRLAVVAGDSEQAIAALRHQLEHRDGSTPRFVKLKQDAASDATRREYGISLLKKSGGDYAPAEMKAALEQLAQLWLEGYRLPWAQWYGERPPQRLSLPLYPFARGRYWAVEGSSAQPLHPLLHRDVSAAGSLRFTTWFTGNEALLQDHQLAGQPLLPGVAHLEWARAAAAVRLGSDTPVVIEQVAWLRPLIVSRPLEVHISLQQESDGRLAFEIFSDAENRVTLYSQGWVRPINTVRGAAPVQDIDRRSQRCPVSVSRDAFYKHFAADGLAYGSHFCVVSALLKGEDVATARLAREAEESEADWGLPAGLLDGALQITALFNSQGGVCLPFALQSVEQWGPLPVAARAVVSRSAEDSIAAPKFDVDIVNEDGTVAVRLLGYSARPRSHHIKENEMMENTALAEEERTLLLLPEWHAVKKADSSMDTADQASAVTVIHWPLADSGQPLPDMLQQLRPDARLLWYVPAGVDDTAREALRLIRALLKQGFDQQPLRLTIVTCQAMAMHAQQTCDAEAAGLQGLIGSVAKQYSHWQVTLLDLPLTVSLPEKELLAQPADPSGNPRRWHDGHWYQQQLKCEDLPAPSRPLYREGGIYVIVGGAGGLGVAFSEHLLRQCRAQLVWLGRRPEDATIAAARERLSQYGPAPVYLQADASDRKAMRQAEAEIVQRFGQPAGIIHSALVLDDCSIAAMTDERFDAAFKAKTRPPQIVDEVFGHHSLDFVLFFGALMSFLKAPGQGNYAAGCCYADAVAHRLAEHRPYPVKVMLWGYWGSIGAVATPFYQQRMAQLGMGSIDPEMAMCAVDRLLASEHLQAAWLKTSAHPLPLCLNVTEGNSRQTMPVQRIVTEAVKIANLSTQGQSQYSGDTHQTPPDAELRQLLRQCVLQALALHDSDLEDDRSFSAYGVDSISSVALVSAINKRLGMRLPATLLYDYPDINRLVEHLRAHFPASLNNGAGLSPSLTRPGIPSPLFASPVQTNCSSVSSACVTATEETVASPKQSALCSSPVTEGNVSGGERYQRLLLEEPGSIDDIRVVEDEISPPGPGEVRIAVRAFSLNFADLLCVHGLYPTQPPYPFTPGNEVSGVVTAVGGDVTGIACGDRVIALAGEAMGAHATLMNCSRERVFPCPPSLSFTDACALPSVAITVLECFARAGLKAGERVLIQTATGGVGLLAVQLAQHLGAEVFATAGSQHKLDYLMQKGVANPINYRQEDFAAAIQRLTQGEGVDVILNTLDGDAMQKSFGILRAGGRYVDIAMTALKSARAIDLSILNNNQSIHCVDIRKLGLQKPEVLAGHVHNLNSLLATGAVTPTVSKIFPFEAAHDAFRWLAGRRQIGKVVVSISPKAEPEGRAALTAEARKAPSDAIAVIGMSGRFASASDLTRFWQVLVNGEDLVEKASRWPGAELNSRSATTCCNSGGFLKDTDQFDPLFFDISSMEAAQMDPQQRLFLQEAWHALEDAGYAGQSAEGRRFGVFVGCTAGDYLPLLGEAPPAQAFWGNAASVIPARIAFHLNWNGPVVATDTSCSSSLVAIHQACQALQNDDAELVIAGGVYVQSTPLLFRQANEAGMLSNRGHCSSFDNRADGFVPGEGVAALILKRLSQAVADGDSVYGVIRGSGINHDGATNGLTAPSGPAQTRLLRNVWERHGIDPSAIQLVEAHGTGTVLGDPIEFNALTAAFGSQVPRGYCALGSVKSNIGHCAPAAGIAGVLKILLALEHRQIPPSLHFSQGNQHIDFTSSPFYVPTRPQPWEVPPGVERQAAVNSFGFSGTNAHVVISEAPAFPSTSSSRAMHLIVTSARSSGQLRDLVKAMVTRLDSGPIDLGAMSFTLLTGRRHQQHRLACVAKNVPELREQLSQWLNGLNPAGVISGETEQNSPPASSFGQALLKSCATVSSERALHQALSGLAALYVQGVSLNWEQLADPASRRRIRLPLYPFARERYGVDPAKFTPSRQVSEPTSAEGISVASDRTEANMPTDVQAEVREIFMRTLSLSHQQLRNDIDFARYGIDSVLRLQLLRLLNARFNLALTLAELEEHASIARLCRYIGLVTGKASPQADIHIRPAETLLTDDAVYLAGSDARKSDVVNVWQELFLCREKNLDSERSE